MNKFSSGTTFRVAILILSLTFWTYLSIVAFNLRPIADEICVLGELKNGESFPPFHLNPRILATLFTWGSSIMWVSNYTAGIALNWAIISLLFGLNVKKLYEVFSIEVSRTQALAFGLVVTPFFILFLPPNNQAIYDTFFWFGGSWHAVGALIAMYVVLNILNLKTTYTRTIGLVCVGSLWSEVTSIVVAVAILIHFIFHKNRMILLILIPAAVLAVHAYISVENGRLSASTESRQSFVDVNTLKGLVLMYILLLIHGIVIAAITRLWFSFKEKKQLTETSSSQKIHVICFVVAGFVLFQAFALTYATWRSTVMLGVCGLLIGTILWQRVSLKTLMNKIVLLGSLVVILMINAGGLLPMLDAVELRKNWWEVNNSKGWIDISTNVLNQDQKAKLPADWGNGEWVDECFRKIQEYKK
jgi:hypothetical protein